MNLQQTVTATVFLSSLFLLIETGASAQTPYLDSTPSPTTAQEGFTKLSQQGKSIVAEPVPNHLAAGFDKAMRSTVHGDFALCTPDAKVQFSLPPVTVEEVMAWIKSSRSLLAPWWSPKPIPPGMPFGAYRIVSIVRNLEKSGKNHVPLSQLGAEDKEMADTLLFRGYIGSLADDTQWTEKVLSNLSKAYLIKEDRDGRPSVLQLGIEGKEAQPRAVLQDYNVTPDLSVMEAAADKLEGQTTLGELVASLNLHSNVRLSLVPGLVDKPVVVQGADKQVPGVVLRRIAEMYKLRVLSDTASMRLALPMPNAVTNPVQLRTSLLRVVPAPLLGWAFADPETIESSAQLQGNMRGREWRNKLYGYLGSIYDKEAKGKAALHVPVNSLTSRERSALAVALAYQCLEDMANGLSTVPAWIEKYNEVSIDVGRQIVDGQETGYIIFTSNDGKPVFTVRDAHFGAIPEKQ